MRETRIRRRYIGVAVALLAIAIGSQLVRVGCELPYLQSVSPDGRETLVVCRRPMLFGMPGGASDAPGWIVLRDARGYAEAVISLGMVQVAEEPEWTDDTVIMKLTASFARHAPKSTVVAWLTDRWWRLRALFRAVPSDTSFR